MGHGIVNTTRIKADSIEFVLFDWTFEFNIYEEQSNKETIPNCWLK